jgi:hypothetical protein
MALSIVGLAVKYNKTALRIMLDWELHVLMLCCKSLLSVIMPNVVAPLKKGKDGLLSKFLTRKSMYVKA